METSRCKNCSNKNLVPDHDTGNMVCSHCGVVQDFDNYQAHIGGLTGAAGTYIRVGKAGTGSVSNYKEKKIFEAHKVIEDFLLKLGLSGTRSSEVKLLIEKITDGEYGEGKWFPILVGACIYVVMRKDKRVLPMVEVADVVCCDEYELGRMINRVVDFIDLKLPEFDIVYTFECAIKKCPTFAQTSENIVQRMLEQGVFLLQCLIKWFVTTGRKPMPVVVAVLVFVAELNQVHVKIEDVANELHSAVRTCRLRYKELLERLVKVARVLPWGKDVTVKNILKNAPSVIQYMEMKSMTKFSEGRQRFEFFQDDMEGLIGDCLRTNEFDSYAIEDCSCNYFEVNSSSNPSSGYPDKFQISPESLSIIYSSYLDEISLVKATAEIGRGNKRRRQTTFDLQECTDWWNGKSDLSKKLFLKQMLEKDVGLDGMPPSFDKACLVKGKRREKIKAAKLRIQRIMHPAIANSVYKNDISVFEPEKSKKKRKKVLSDIDWEDLIIETLLLHNVKEEEIEKGHYNVLLALHVFHHGIDE